MKVTRRERRWRDALMLSMIDPGSMTTTALSHAFHTARKPMAAGRLLGRAAASLHPGSDANTQFWTHFEQRAPFHLQLALRGASALIAGVLPRLCGHLRSLDKLDDDLWWGPGDRVLEGRSYVFVENGVYLLELRVGSTLGSVFTCGNGGKCWYNWPRWDDTGLDRFGFPLGRHIRVSFAADCRTIQAEFFDPGEYTTVSYTEWYGYGDTR